MGHLQIHIYKAGGIVIGIGITGSKEETEFYGDILIFISFLFWQMSIAYYWPR